MPNYIASNLGGLGNSGVFPDSRPQINVADAINATAGAFNQTKQGILQRAMLQASNARAEKAQRLQEAEAAQNGVVPLAAAKQYISARNADADAWDAANAPSTPQIQYPSERDSSIPPGGPTGGTLPRLQMPQRASGSTPQIIAPSASGTGTTPPSAIPDSAMPARAPIATSSGASSSASSVATGSGARPQRYTMIDLGNGYAQIPELTPGYRQTQLLQQRLNNAQIVEQLRNAGHLAWIDENGQIQLERDKGKEAAASDLVDKKGGLTLQEIAARGHTQMGIATLRAGLKSDPSAMNPLQRANLYQKLGQMYVGGANGDLNEAIETAKNDPHLKDYGVTPDQLQGYIGSAAMAVKQKQDAGDARGALQLLTSYATPDAGQVETAVHTVQSIHPKAGGGAGAPTPTPSALAPLSARDKQMAKTNPAFAAHLAGEGYRAGKDY